MIAVVVCRDGAASPETRKAVLPEHRAYVDAHAPMLVMSGPLLASDGTTRTGQLFILDVPDRQTAERFIADDPFTRAGLFTDIEVDGFVIVFRDGQRV